MKFERVKQQNFYIARYGDHTILKSYNTIVGIITNEKLYQVKYSRTTSKQVSQYCNSHNVLERYELMNDEILNEVIKAQTGLDLDTRYNCANYTTIK
jgi:hypothetical protein